MNFKILISFAFALSLVLILESAIEVTASPVASKNTEQDPEAEPPVIRSANSPDQKEIQQPKSEAAQQQTRQPNSANSGYSQQNSPPSESEPGRASNAQKQAAEQQNSQQPQDASGQQSHQSNQQRQQLQSASQQQQQSQSNAQQPQGASGRRRYAQWTDPTGGGNNPYSELQQLDGASGQKQQTKWSPGQPEGANGKQKAQSESLPEPEPENSRNAQRNEYQQGRQQPELQAAHHVPGHNSDEEPSTDEGRKHPELQAAHHVPGHNSDEEPSTDEGRKHPELQAAHHVPGHNSDEEKSTSTEERVEGGNEYAVEKIADLREREYIEGTGKDGVPNFVQAGHKEMLSEDLLTDPRFADLIAKSFQAGSSVRYENNNDDDKDSTHLVKSMKKRSLPEHDPTDNEIDQQMTREELYLGLLFDMVPSNQLGADYNAWKGRYHGYEKVQEPEIFDYDLPNDTEAIEPLDDFDE